MTAAPLPTASDPRQHPALVRCGERFWAGMARVAVSVPLADVLPSDNEFRRKLLVQKREADLLRIPAQVTLTEVADWVSLPPEYARGYLRAVHRQLEACGLTLLERRLGAADTLGMDMPYGGAFMPKSEKVELERHVRTAAQVIRTTARDVKLRTKELNRAERALTAAEKRVAKGKQGDDLEALTAAVERARDAVESANAAESEALRAHEELTDQLTNTQFLPLPRMGFAPIRNISPNGA
ncbi:Uncharacterised protein [Mycobacteroides abscessus]|uniref:hypothetical protein n=1 Tax=Mycobacteroides abscessus TaxID=36809 RepID=UPI0005DC7ED0|nr:hypothetical protein [Mycobacteroides abscessus]CPX20602.1 Uncharacterised protein [Mycobacteroides abscessus]CRG61223.1 Uncharacterised protein [Mycobacteroides abscessus]